MTSKKFVKFTEEEIASFTEDQENANTKKKTVSDLKLFNEFLNSEEEERNIENIPAAELQQLAKKFVLGVRKKNGEEYEPSSLRGFLQSVDRYLRKKGCTFSLLNDKEFCEVQDILKKKQKQVKAIGKGNKPNSADTLTDEEIEEFYRAGVGGSVIERVVTYKLLGVYISDDLSWNVQMEHIVKKANMRLYALRALKKGGLTITQLVQVYCSIVRSVLEYACPVWAALPKYLEDAIESVQKRALRIVLPNCHYDDALIQSGITALSQRREEACINFMKRDCPSSPVLKRLIPCVSIGRPYCLRSGTPCPQDKAVRRFLHH